jgi:tight adherence protein B
MELLIAISVFISVSAGLLAVVQARTAAALAAQARLERVAAQTTPAEWAGTPIALRGSRFSSIPWLERFLSELDLARALDLMLIRANWNMRVSEFLILTILTGALFFLLAWVLLGQMLIAVALGVAAAALPLLVLRRAMKKRIAAIEGQLEEALTLISNALKAGFGLMQAIDQAARQLKPPVADELRQLVRDTHIGASIDQAVLDLGQRVGSYDLDNVAHTIRERNRIRREIKTLTAEMRASGVVIALIPPAMAVLLFLLNREYMMVLFTEPLGHLLLAASVVMQGIGMIVIRRIMSIEV